MVYSLSVNKNFLTTNTAPPKQIPKMPVMPGRIHINCCTAQQT